MTQGNSCKTTPESELRAEMSDCIGPDHKLLPLRLSSN